MLDTRVLFIGEGPAHMDAGGGGRRTHQLLHELRSHFGRDAVLFLTTAEIFDNMSDKRARPQNTATRILNRALKSAKFRLHATVFKSGLFRLSSGMRNSYRKRIEKLPRLKVCIFEEPSLAGFHAINKAFGIKTVLAPWCFTTLRTHLPHLIRGFEAAEIKADTFRDRTRIRAAFRYFSDELLLHARTDCSWLVSKVEQGFLEASGISAEYLPFYPAGEAYEQLQQLRNRRSAGSIDNGLFVISGSGNQQNSVGLFDFLKTVDQKQLPDNARIVVVGIEVMPKTWTKYFGGRIQFRGWLCTPDFYKLLSQARAVLVPQVGGFGCITRIPEMLIAGIPVVADGIASNATGPLPGAKYITPGPERWSNAIRELLAEPAIVPQAGINSWIAQARQQVMHEFDNL